MTLGLRIAAWPWAGWLSASSPGTGSAVRIAGRPAAVSPGLAARIVAVSRHRPGLRLQRLWRHGLRRHPRRVPDLISWLPLVPDLTRWFSIVPDLARRIDCQRLPAAGLCANFLRPDGLDPQWLDPQWLAMHWLGPGVGVRDNRRDRAPDPERAEPLLGLDIT